MQETYKKWYTPHLSREFEMLVFGQSGYPVIIFPTSMGRYYQNKDFKLIESAAHLIDAGKIRVYTPDGIDNESWYNKSIHPADRVKTHMAYEKVIFDEVLSMAMNETGKSKVCVGGCSFGGYHAVNLAFRHPEVTGYVITMSGAFDIKQFLHGYYDENCYFNNPPDYLVNVQESEYLQAMRRMGIILSTGERDFCLEWNRQFSQILHGKGIPNWLDVRPGGEHDWPVWRQLFPLYLSIMLQKEGML
jgi:esterase/lipase superfamily enzyme